MAGYRNGLYYESVDIRNAVLSRNIGKYWGYKHSFLENGGLAVGMPYAVETELTPFPLSARSNDGLHLGGLFTKDENPKISIAFREGGLFGYTHEVINPYYDWITRNENLLRSYYDYPSTEDLKDRLDRFPTSLPWGEQGLRWYSSSDDPQNSQYFEDYREYIRSLFTNGTSFDKSLGEGYKTRILYNGFNREDIITNVSDFIEEKSGYIIDDVDELKRISDTELGYVGRILLDEHKLRQVNNDHRQSVSPESELTYRPGITDAHYGSGYPFMKTGLDNVYNLFYGYGDDISFSTGGDGKYIRDLGEVVGEHGEYVDDYEPGELQKSALRAHVMRWRDDFRNEDYIGYIRTLNTQPEQGFSVDTVIGGVGASSNIYDGTESHFGDNTSTRVQEVYDERDEANNSIRSSFDGMRYGDYTITGIDTKTGYQGFFNNQPKSLLSKTQELFTKHKIKTLVGRFHTSEDDKDSHKVSLIQSAVDSTFGISHGRNLLKGYYDTPNDYTNPYCRVWTYHHQYAKMTDLIRPFIVDGEFAPVDKLQVEYPGRPILANAGRGSWAEKTVLNKNGLVNIAPTKKIGKGDELVVKAKQCMFSIENLAWKGVNKEPSIIDKGEIGPLGGRIMWFPPYNLQFNESVSVNWGSNEFIGRGERIYSYTNTERTGTLSFTILADHPSILDYWRREKYGDGPGDVEGDQSVLRFFAGCEPIGAPKTQEQGLGDVTQTEYNTEQKEVHTNNPENENENLSPTPNDNVEEDITTGPPDEFTKDNSIGFYVYFPNNLSGVDFIKNPKVIVNYLVHGQDGFDFNPSLDGGEMTFDDQGNGSALLPADGVFVGDWSDKILLRTPSNGPGYEMGRGYLTEDSIAQEIVDFNGKKANDNGRNYIWGYGVDVDKVKERLCGPHGAKGDKTFKIFPDNYVDKKPYGSDRNVDFGLNATANNYDEACGYSFLDVAKALSIDYNYYANIPGGENAEKVKKILGLDDPNKVKNAGGRKFYFAIAGGASVHGYQDKNTGLSQRRAAFLKSWLESCFEKLNLQVDYDMEAKIPIVTGIQGGESDLDVNSESAKRGRYAKAVIYWNDEDVKDATDAEQEYDENSTGSTGVLKEQVIPDDTDNITNEEAAESTTLMNSATLTDFSSTRYRDEEEFFSLVKESDPVLFKNITDKVKYFDPVYHSITPEGFNARLSFLHQCTRQGPTMSSSDLTQNSGVNGAGYAGNLSFGRAPVCVLRLGDFYNTRIVINSLAIQYETGQWDLNPEGIGVQPMLANVTIGFSFQGGSSLGGPIQRLQNAVSFNYYANQEVYDDRADVAVYGEDGELSDSSYVWIPGFGGTNLGSVKNFTDIQQQISEKNAYEHQKDMGGPIDTTMENLHIDINLKEYNKQKRERQEAKEDIEDKAQ